MRLTAKAREIILQLKKERKALRQSALQKDERIRMLQAGDDILQRDRQKATDAARQARRTATTAIALLERAIDALDSPNSASSRSLCAEALRVRTGELGVQLHDQLHAFRLYDGANAQPISDSYALAEPKASTDWKA